MKKEVERITTKAPREALRELHKHYKLKYIIYEGLLTYKGYDIAHLGDKKIAEAILFENEPVQVRLLKEKPYKSRGIYQVEPQVKEIQFGGF